MAFGFIFFTKNHPLSLWRREDSIRPVSYKYLIKTRLKGLWLQLQLCSSEQRSNACIDLMQIASAIQAGCLLANEINILDAVVILDIYSASRVYEKVYNMILLARAQCWIMMLVPSIWSVS